MVKRGLCKREDPGSVPRCWLWWQTWCRGGGYSGFLEPHREQQVCAGLCAGLWGLSGDSVGHAPSPWPDLRTEDATWLQEPERRLSIGREVTRKDVPVSKVLRVRESAVFWEVKLRRRYMGRGGEGTGDSEWEGQRRT